MRTSSGGRLTRNSGMGGSELDELATDHLQGVELRVRSRNEVAQALAVDELVRGGVLRAEIRPLRRVPERMHAQIVPVVLRAPQLLLGDEDLRELLARQDADRAVVERPSRLLAERRGDVEHADRKSVV